MPTLEKVLCAFPSMRFLLNGKSNDPTEAEALLRYLETRGFADLRRLSVDGGWRPIGALELAYPEVRTWTKQKMKRCALRNVMLGWSSYVPKACRGTMFVVPINLRHLM